MKITPAQLAPLISKPLSAIYVVSGDEVLLAEETLTAIRTAAKKQGFDERERVATDTADWAKALYTSTHSLSLFTQKRLLELDLTEAKLTAANCKSLQEFAESPVADTVLLIRLPKLDQKIQKTAWYKTLETKGIVIQIWPINTAQLPSWIMQRAKNMNLQLTQRAANLLAQFSEGNLLAAAQEIEKLQLLSLSATIDENQIADLMKDSAQFDVYALVESTLSGNNARSVRILNQLQAQGIEPTLILWALMSELRLLNTLTQRAQTGSSLSALFAEHRVWEKRQGPIQQFLRRHKKSFLHLFSQAAKTDQLIKGAESGNVWDSLQDLALSIGGL